MVAILKYIKNSLMYALISDYLHFPEILIMPKYKYDGKYPRENPK